LQLRLKSHICEIFFKHSASIKSTLKKSFENEKPVCKPAFVGNPSARRLRKQPTTLRNVLGNSNYSRHSGKLHEERFRWGNKKPATLP